MRPSNAVSEIGWTVTVLQQVRALIIARTPQAICDDCIAAKLNLSVRQHANHKTRELEKLPRYDRRVQVCSVCGSEKKSICWA
jgi:hypothetical protein